MDDLRLTGITVYYTERKDYYMYTCIKSRPSKSSDKWDNPKTVLGKRYMLEN